MSKGSLVDADILLASWRSLRPDCGAYPPGPFVELPARCRRCRTTKFFVALRGL